MAVALALALTRGRASMRARKKLPEAAMEERIVQYSRSGSELRDTV